MSDITTLLAEALHAAGDIYDDCRWRHREDQDDVDAGLALVRVYRDCEPEYHREKAAAILAAPGGQRIAAVIEAAVAWRVFAQDPFVSAGDPESVTLPLMRAVDALLADPEEADHE